jgi:chromosome segregation ATPase
MLQAQLDVERKRHGGESGPLSHFGSADPTADGESRVAWMEERRGLEKEIMQLQEKCRTLEMEKMMAQTKIKAASNHQELSGAALREPELAQKLRLEEAARTTAEQRVHSLEDQLVRCQAQCEELRKRLPEVERSKSDEHRKAKDLEAQVISLRETKEEQERTLHECNDRVLQGQRDLQGIRSDYDILVRTNESLKMENNRLKEDLDSTKEKARTADTQLATLRSQFSMTETQLSSKVDQLASMAHGASEALEHTNRKHGEAEKELSTWKTESLELKSKLASLRTAHEDLQARSESREGDLCAEIVAWKQKYSDMQSEKELLGAQLDGALQEKQDLQARSQDYLKQCEEASKALMHERKRTQDVNDRSKGMVIEMERRGQVLMRQLDDEKHRNAQLTRELSAACEAARTVQVHPRTRAKTSSKYGSDSEAGLRTPDKAAKGKTGWSAVITRMQKELDELQQWKGSALNSLQQSQGGMDYLQSKYKRQLQYNQQLQQRLEELGRHAKEAVGSVEQSHGGPGNSSDEDLSSPSAIPKPSGTNGFHSTIPTGTSNDLLGASHPEDVLGMALGNSASTGVLGMSSKVHRSRSQDSCQEHQRSQRSLRSEPVRIPPGRADHRLAGPDLPEHGKSDFRTGRLDYGEFSSSTMDADSQASSSVIDTWPSSHGVFYDTAASMDRSASRSINDGNRKRRSRSLGGATRARRREENARATAKLMSKSSAKSL